MSRTARPERGAAVVEAALLLPFLLLVALGVADLGRAHYVKIGVQEAAQEGASYAAAFPADPAGARLRASQAGTNPPLAVSDVTVTCPSATQVSVTVSYTMPMITPFISGLVGDHLALSHSATAMVHTAGSCTPG